MVTFRCIVPPTMKRAICPSSVVASWLFCVLVVGLSPFCFGQLTLPPLIPVNVPSLTIPFEIDGTANTIREVELFVSQDRGRRWQSVVRLPVETGKFTFRAEADGEYWFASRTITSTGTPSSMTGYPELRVLVDTKNPGVALPPQPSEPKSVVPPKPQRFRPESTQKSQPMQQVNIEEPKTHEPETRPVTNLEEVNTKRSTQILAPKLPGFDLTELETNKEENLLDNLLSEMSSFLDVQPVATRTTPSPQIAADGSPVAPNVPVPSKNTAEAPAGSISGMDLQPTDSGLKIIVRWNTGQELWRGAQIDILRSNTQEGDQVPVPIESNLPNNGEYWWYLSPEDLKPFYITVRIRSPHDRVGRTDITQSKIEIAPLLEKIQNQRP